MHSARFWAAVDDKAAKNPESTGCWEHRINFSYVESRGNLQYDYPSLKIGRAFTRDAWPLLPPNRVECGIASPQCIAATAVRILFTQGKKMLSDFQNLDLCNHQV